ncbi:TVP38/TMEM64 family protein [Marinobacter similis]|uniref:TVP38/TMEM64 family protein n=1 Tax=Marinobacter similis TaxID=1420916 RepID=UPI001F1FCA85|nr:VTT domain-containing protein [Marinobacter similis]
MLDLLHWVDRQGAWAAIMFIAIMALAIVLLLPGVLLTTGAGFVFGVVEGTTYVVVGTTLGAAISFLIARYFLGDRAHVYIQNRVGLLAVSGKWHPTAGRSCC